MADPSSVNPQISDTVASDDANGQSQRPAMHLAEIQHSMAHSLGILFFNAVQQQNAQAQAGLASTVAAIDKMLGK